MRRQISDRILVRRRAAIYMHVLDRNRMLTLLNVRKRTRANADRLDPGQPPSKSAASLRSNPFATRSIIRIPLQNQVEFQRVFKADTR